MSFLQSLDGKLSFVTTGGKALCLVNDRLHAGTNTDMEEETTVSKLAVYTGTILLALGASGARTADVITEAGALACVTDRWAETESGKRANYSGRCIVLPSDSAASKATETCTGTWEVMDDGGWRGAGTCTHVYKDGDDWSFEWQQVKENGKIVITGGTGRFAGVKGHGTFKLEELAEGLAAGTYSQTLDMAQPVSD